MKQLLRVGLLGGLLCLCGCNEDGERPLKIGVTAGPHEDILEFIQPMAEEQGAKFRVVVFNDFILPNAALASGDLDANCYQHYPFLEDQVASRGYDFVYMGPTILLPMAVYSESYGDLKALPEGALVAIPNDPTNESRALYLLKDLGIITLKNESTQLTPLDIASNPKKLRFIELESPQLPRSLSEVDAAVINADWVLLAGMDPMGAIATEDATDSPYANLFVVRRNTEEDAEKRERYEQLQSIYRLYSSDATKAFIVERFGKAVLPARVHETGELKHVNSDWIDEAGSIL